jgi:protein O-GlcNAc transferase
MSNPLSPYNLALQRHQAGKLAEAEQLYRQALAPTPDHSDANNGLGVLLMSTNRCEQAIAHFQQAIASRPEFAAAHANLAIAFSAIGRLDEAVAACRRAIELNPNYAEAHGILGNALRKLGRHEESIAAGRAALALQPKRVEMHLNLGGALEAAGQIKEAFECYKRAVAMDANSPDAQFGLANLLHAAGKSNESIAFYRRAISLRPNSAEMHCNLGIALQAILQIDDSVACFERAVELGPNLAKAHYNLAKALQETGYFHRAIAAYDRAMELDPINIPADSNRVYASHFDPDADGPSMLREHVRWNQRHAAPLAALIRPHENDRSPDRPLRIGYVSPHFRDHVVGFNMLPLLSRHDRGQFEVYCYYNFREHDPFTKRFQDCATGWRDIMGMDDERCADLIRTDRIDVLLDLTLHMGYSRLLVFARKPAPVQVTFAGYPGGTGLTAMDWRLTDPYLDPPGQTDGYYVEKSYRLPDSFWCYDPSLQPDVALSKQNAGDNFTFGCLNYFGKINEGVLEVWKRILDAVPGSRLLLLAGNGSQRDRVSKRLDNRVDSLSTLPRKDYLDTYNRIDISLDPFPYGGHTTALDSFWMGVPVVTLVGRTSVGRAGWSHLNNLGMTEYAAQTTDQYVKLAIELAHDRPRLAELRRTLRQRMLASPLTDAARFTRNVETAYRTMWKQWCQKKD